MVESDKNPISEAQIQAQKEEKKIIVHSPRGKHLRTCSLSSPKLKGIYTFTENIYVGLKSGKKGKYLGIEESA